MRAIYFPLSLVLACGWLSCAHYQAGDGSGPPFTSLQIAPVTNLSLAPQANAVINNDLRHAFLQDGRLRLSSQGGEALLKTTLDQFTRTVVATSSTDTALARKYRLSFVAKCDLVDQTTGTPFFKERIVTVSLDIFLDSGQTRSETHAIPLLSKKLASKIADEVLQVW